MPIYPPYTNIIVTEIRLTLDCWIKKFVFVQSLTLLNIHSFLSIGLFKQLQFASIYYKALKKNFKCQLPFSWSSRHVLSYPSAIS